MASQRIYTVEQVSDLLQQIRPIVTSQMAQYRRIQAGISQLAEAMGEVPDDLDDGPEDSDDLASLKTHLRRLVHEYERGWNSVEALGAVVKDASQGLIRFYGQIEGRVVWLTWRHGDADSVYFHELSSDIEVRRPVGERNLLN